MSSGADNGAWVTPQSETRSTLLGKCPCSACPHHLQHVDAELIIQDQVDRHALVLGAEQELAHGSLRVLFVMCEAMPWNKFENAEKLGIWLQSFVRQCFYLIPGLVIGPDAVQAIFPAVPL